VRALTSSLTDAELATRLEESLAKVTALRAQLEQLQKAVTRPVSPHARDQLNKEIARFKVRCAAQPRAGWSLVRRGVVRRGFLTAESVAREETEGLRLYELRCW
jgi:ribosomal protein L29